MGHRKNRNEVSQRALKIGLLRRAAVPRKEREDQSFASVGLDMDDHPQHIDD
jgi:hypothetical protein